MIRLDMTEYMERHAVARLDRRAARLCRLRGGRAAHRARAPAPLLASSCSTRSRRRIPTSTTSAAGVRRGRLTDGKGRVVDFTNTVIIATSNLGADIIQRHLQASRHGRRRAGPSRRELMDVLRSHFRPEFLNRIDEIIVFHALDREADPRHRRSAARAGETHRPWPGRRA